MFRRKLIRELKLSQGRTLQELADREGIATADARQIGTDVFESLCRRAVADNVINPQERRFLKRAARQLGFSPAHRNRLIRSVSATHIAEIEQGAQLLGGMIEAEAEELNVLREAVGLPLRLNENTQTANAAADEPTVSPLQRRLTRSHRILLAFGGVLAVCSVAAVGVVIWLFAGHGPRNSSQTLTVVGVTIGWVLSMGLFYAWKSQHAVLVNKLSIRILVVHVLSRDRTENVAYSQRTYHDEEEGVVRSVKDPGYCASTFGYTVYCEGIGDVSVRRKLYFQLDPGECYLVSINTIGPPEISKVIRSADVQEYAVQQAGKGAAGRCG
ncbi:MAG: hypothetical protein NXI04_04245 [Planctomycetaceae bacterium]|nr:hypothetical protein [Planctomycetaceae bacterium]